MGLKDDVLDIKKEFQEVRKSNEFNTKNNFDIGNEFKKIIYFLLLLIIILIGTIIFFVIKNNEMSKELSEWCKMYNINYQTAWKKIKNGKSIEKALKIKL